MLIDAQEASVDLAVWLSVKEVAALSTVIAEAAAGVTVSQVVSEPSLIEMVEPLRALIDCAELEAIESDVMLRYPAW